MHVLIFTFFVLSLSLSPPLSLSLPSSLSLSPLLSLSLSPPLSLSLPSSLSLSLSLSCRGMTPIEAMTEFLDIASRLDFYGMIFFEVKVGCTVAVIVAHTNVITSLMCHSSSSESTCTIRPLAQLVVKHELLYIY